MRISQTTIPGCVQLSPRVLADERGTFVKTYHEGLFAEHGLETQFREEYYSCSRRRVLRGLHFQLPPMHHTKVVCCLRGEVLDAVVDLRRGSPTYGQYETFVLNADQASMLYIPPGLAHGFYVISDEAILFYRVSTVYSAPHDAGLLWNSAGIPWPEGQPILSRRDSQFPPLSGFSTPFCFGQSGRAGCGSDAVSA